MRRFCSAVCKERRLYIGPLFVCEWYALVSYDVFFPDYLWIQTVERKVSMKHNLSLHTRYRQCS